VCQIGVADTPARNLNPKNRLINYLTLKISNPNNQVQFLARLMRVLRMSSQKSGTPKNFCVAKFEIQIKFINQTSI